MSSDAEFLQARARSDQAWQELQDIVRAAPPDVKRRLHYLCDPDTDRRELLAAKDEELFMLRYLASTAFGECFARLLEGRGKGL